MHTLRNQRHKVGEAIEKLEMCRDCSHSPNDGNNYCEPCERTGGILPELLSALF